MGFVRTDIGWLYLLAGAGAVGAAVVYQRSKEGEALPLAGSPPMPQLPPPPGKAPKAKVRHVDLRGDELAVALAPPLARLLATKGASLEDRWSGPGWSPNNAEIVSGPKVDVTILAIGPGKNADPAHLVGWHGGLANAGRAPVIVLVHPRSKRANEIAQALRRSRGHLILPLRDLPLGPDGITPTMATAAVWATDVVHRLGG